MLACGGRHWPLWGWAQCDTCTLAQRRLMRQGNPVGILKGPHASSACATSPSLTLDGDLAKDLQPLQGRAVPPARVKLVLALLDSQLRTSLHCIHGFHLPPANADLLVYQPHQTLAATGVLEDCPQRRLLGQVPVGQGRDSVTDGLESRPCLWGTSPL